MLLKPTNAFYSWRVDDVIYAQVENQNRAANSSSSEKLFTLFDLRSRRLVFPYKL